ncbi:MAG: pyridine nucleotide-disulfide oxidoreductase [Verrucomicrobiales bacterium]|nr:pyridine nucleotide-disulfide oxidoreductase [Verrucomicrobiales bacterium]
MPLTEHELDCDVLVAGGGAAGVPCALAAARNGAKVILCQDRPALGGNASSEVRMHIVGANGTGSFDRGEELKTEAREGGIIEEIRLDNCVLNPQRSASVFDLILYDKCRTESNLTLLLNTTVVSVEKHGNQIESAIAERQSTEDRFRISARIFVDCTGDGRLGFEAGAAFMEGRESNEQFNESLAIASADNQRLGSTILLQARKHDRPMPFVAPDWVREFTKDELKLRLYATPGEEEPTHEYGYWWAEWGGTLDTIKDNEEIRDELLAITLGIWNHIKNGPEADAFDASLWALDWIGFLPGKRESRRFIGKHILTENDILESREFHDTIAYGGWSLDLHPPEGVDAPDQEPCVQTPVPFLYDIPLSCCVARDIENLMFAGRNISATHVAFSSTRVMATCAAVGQGVGTAAAHCARDQINDSDEQRIRSIQQRLLRDDAFLIGRKLEPGLEADASITASNGDPSPLLSGQTRSVHGEKGAAKDRAMKGVHRWMSSAEEGLPAWVILEWTQPIEISGVRIVFDTGLHRHLTLSHHDGYTSKMIWGKAQPETGRAYSIEARDKDTWTTLWEIDDNHQRLRHHELNKAKTLDALRLTVHQTNGIDHARIMQIRVE